MNRLLLAVLLGASGWAHAADYPPFSAGEKDVVFKQVAPDSSDAELKRRFRWTNEPRAYDIVKEKFRFYIPNSYRHKDEWGLFVWIDPTAKPNLLPEWKHVFADKKLLFVGAHGSGNERNVYDRARLAIDAAHNMKQRFHIDPNRIYVAGLSGGGRLASMLGVAYGDVFAGTFPIVGSNFYQSIPTADPNKSWGQSYTPDPLILESAKSKNRYVLLTGEDDFNRDSTDRIFRHGFEAEKFQHILYLEVPGMGHTFPPVDWFTKGIEFLDEKPQ